MQHLAETTVAILAGGLGTRLRSQVSDRPKVLAPVANQPFLTYLLEQLSRAGCRRVVLCTGYLGEQVAAEFGGGYGNIEIECCRETHPLGTGGALRFALPQLRSSSVLVLNGDSYCDVDLADFWQWQTRYQGAASMVLVRVPDTQRYGRVEIDADGRVLSFEEKGNTSGEGWINAGIYVIPRDAIAALPDDRPVSLERELLPQLLEETLWGYTTSADFIDIGTPESFTRAQEFFQRQR